jgi:hypothetical protein
MYWLKFEIKLFDDETTNSKDNDEKAWNYETHS